MSSDDTKPDVIGHLRNHVASYKTVTLHRQHCLHAADLIEALWPCFELLEYGFVKGMDSEIDAAAENVKRLFSEDG